MHRLLVLCLFIVGTFSVKLEHDGDIYDILDTKKIVETDELRKAAYACLMDLGPCSEEYQIIRGTCVFITGKDMHDVMMRDVKIYLSYVIPRILKTQCADCTASQKAIYEYNARYLEKHYNDIFKGMLAKYGKNSK